MKGRFSSSQWKFIPRALPFCVNKRRIGARETNLPQLQISLSMILRNLVLKLRIKSFMTFDKIYVCEVLSPFMKRFNSMSQKNKVKNSTPCLT